ncbi:MAG: 3'-5' exonuclease [bacterium]
MAIGIIEISSENSFVLYQSPNQKAQVSKEGPTVFVPTPGEKELLELFWKKLLEYQQVVTFNGRGFDCPFLMVRSSSPIRSTGVELFANSAKSGASAPEKCRSDSPSE